MKITIRELRKLIREEVGTMVFIHNAGFGGMGGLSSMRQNKNASIDRLGDEGEEELETHGEEQEKSQWTVRVRNRKHGT